MWTFEISTGKFLDVNATVLAIGYAGHGAGKDNPADQELKDVGPLPVGGYTMTSVELEDPRTGPFTIVLTPDPSNEMYGRGDFRIHGDAIHAPGTASDGCIVLPRFARERAWESGDHSLQVVE